MRAAKVQASLRIHQNLRCSLIQAVNQEELSDRKPDPGPSEWLDMRSWNLSWRNARRHKFAWRGSISIFYDMRYVTNTKTCLSKHCLLISRTLEPQHDKTNKMPCAPSEDSDEPGYPPSLIRAFAVRMKKAWVFSYHLSAQRRLWSDWADAQADLSLRWAHMPFCCFVMSRLIPSLQFIFPVAILGKHTPLAECHHSKCYFNVIGNWDEEMRDISFIHNREEKTKKVNILNKNKNFTLFWGEIVSHRWHIN